MDERDRIRAFQDAVAERLAGRVEPSLYGTGLFVDDLPGVYDLNYLRAAHGSAEELRAEADRLMERVHHRKVVARHEVDLGWQRNVHLVMTHRSGPDRVVDTAHVRTVPFDEIAPARLLDYADNELGEQLNAAQRRVAAAVDTHWVAAFAGDRLAAWCHVRSAGGVAQIEDVNTLPDLRGRGHARAVVQHALDESRAAHEIVFLEALEDDWPRELYAKLGFEATDRLTHHIRPGHPLTSLRIRTPRLELRLATVAELRQLFRVAEAGIHDPAIMPFEIPWTDDLDESAFVAYHRENVERLGEREWHLNLVAFLDGQPIGTQGLNSNEPGRVVTGSWLGSAYQQQGLGTEMRSAILSFAFDVLGAEVAVSGAFVDNPGSRGVSRRLGYREVGSHFVSPRGEPVEHVDLELRRADFRPLTDVGVRGFDSSWWTAQSR